MLVRTDIFTGPQFKNIKSFSGIDIQFKNEAENKQT